jgi:hypothetical protein
MVPLAKGLLGKSGNELLTAGTWATRHMEIVACGHMHGQHATTESTQDTVSCGKL